MGFKTMKFWIGDDPECSKRVQEMLFNLGYIWGVGDKTIMYIDAPALYSEPDGLIKKGDTRAYFNSDENQEINIDWLRSDKRKTVTLGDKKYYEDELSEALSKINPV